MAAISGCSVVRGLPGPYGGDHRRPASPRGAADRRDQPVDRLRTRIDVRAPPGWPGWRAGHCRASSASASSTPVTSCRASGSGCSGSAPGSGQTRTARAAIELGRGGRCLAAAAGAQRERRRRRCRRRAAAAVSAGAGPADRLRRLPAGSWTGRRGAPGGGRRAAPAHGNGPGPARRRSREPPLGGFGGVGRQMWDLGPSHRPRRIRRGCWESPAASRRAGNSSTATAIQARGGEPQRSTAPAERRPTWIKVSATVSGAPPAFGSAHVRSATISRRYGRNRHHISEGRPA